MGKNYFEHDVQVKYVENLLANSNDWQWLIDYIENNFEIDLCINTFNEFMPKYKLIKDVFAHLIKLNDCEVNFSKKWLEDIFTIVKVYNGKQEFDTVDVIGNFMKLFLIIAHITRLINIKNRTSYLIDFRILSVLYMNY